MQQDQPSSPVKRISKVAPSAGKVMLPLFWYSDVVFQTHFQNRNQTMIVKFHQNSIKTSKPTDDMHHGNAKPNLAHSSYIQEQQNSGGNFLNILTYPQSDCHLFGLFRDHLGGKHQIGSTNTFMLQVLGRNPQLSIIMSKDFGYIF